MEARKSIYRVYMSDALKVIGSLNIRYYDLISSPSKTNETRTPKEIIDGISNKLRAIGSK